MGQGMVTTQHGMRITATEHVSTQAVGGALAVVTHHMVSERKEDFADIWSKIVTVNSGLEVLPVNALPLSVPSMEKDLLTDQQIRVCLMHNVGEHLGNVTFKAGTDTMLLVPLPVDGMLYYFTTAGHLFAAAITTIEIMALTGPVSIELLLGTQKTAP